MKICGWNGGAAGDGEILFRKWWFSRWSVRRLDGYESILMPDNVLSVIAHNCNFLTSVVGYSLPKDSFEAQRCSFCNTAVPDNIVGLWTLHNWEIINGDD